MDWDETGSYLIGIDCVMTSLVLTFAEQDYEKAIELYTEAINLNPYVPAYYGNRSFAHLRVESFGYALADASKAIELDKNYVKAYYRRAGAYMSLGRFKLALKDLEAVSIVNGLVQLLPLSHI